jgi:hypothetical protein
VCQWGRHKRANVDKGTKRRKRGMADHQEVGLCLCISSSPFSVQTWISSQAVAEELCRRCGGCGGGGCWLFSGGGGGPPAPPAPAENRLRAVPASGPFPFPPVVYGGDPAALIEFTIIACCCHNCCCAARPCRGQVGLMPGPSRRPGGGNRGSYNIVNFV